MILVNVGQENRIEIPSIDPAKLEKPEQSRRPVDQQTFTARFEQKARAKLMRAEGVPSTQDLKLSHPTESLKQGLTYAAVRSLVMRTRVLYFGPMKKVRLDPEQVVRAELPTRFGAFEIYGFRNEEDGEEAIALVRGEIPLTGQPLVRIHSQCFTGDTLHSLRCDCGDQLEQALARIGEAQQGILIYQMQEGRGIGLLNKLRAYALQDQGVDTVDANLQLGFEADERDYSFCAEILRFLGAEHVRLMSNNPDKINGLVEADIHVVERVPLIVPSNPLFSSYLRTKKEKMGHLL